MSKPTALAAFATHKANEAPLPADRKRGKGKVVALTVRLSRDDWERVHQLAVAEGTSIQQLAINGLSKVFQEQGLPGIALRR